jgi:hypothetical protein
MPCNAKPTDNKKDTKPCNDGANHCAAPTINKAKSPDKDKKGAAAATRANKKKEGQ